MAERRQVLLYSGGMDSFITAFFNPAAALLYIDTQARYSRKELRHLTVPDARAVTIDNRLDLSAQERDDAIVPARNLLLITLATHYGNEILLAATAGDASTDKDDVFAKQASDLLTYMYASHHFPDFGEVSVQLPFKTYSKAEMVSDYLNEGGNAEKLAATISCYHPTLLHCGQCKPCIRKWVALKVNGIADLVPWAVDPKTYNWAPIKEKISTGQGWRGPQEDASTMDALKDI